MGVSNKHTTIVTRGIIANVLKGYDQGMTRDEIMSWLNITNKQYVEIMHFHKTKGAKDEA